MVKIKLMAGCCWFILGRWWWRHGDCSREPVCVVDYADPAAKQGLDGVERLKARRMLEPALTAVNGQIM